MKFAKVLHQTLIEEDIPQEWVEGAIQYKVLKKCISRIVKELAFLGLSLADLKLLLKDEDDTIEVTSEETVPSNPIVAHYTLKKDRHEVVPYLKIVLNETQTGQYSAAHIQELAEQIRQKLQHSILEDDEPHIMEIKEEENLYVLSPTTSRQENIVTVENHNEIVILLHLDTKFFKMLSAELESLDRIRQSEEDKLVQDIDKLSDKVLQLSRHKSDMYTWRELFRIYLDSEVYFRYNETSSSLLEKLLEQVKKNLESFGDRAEKAQIAKRFKSKQAILALLNFVQMNEHLLKIIQFQLINTTALRKILKKFDKQTSLNVLGRYPSLISQDHVFIAGRSVAQSICYVMQTKLLTIVPQLEDYTCPICMLVAYKPIRLMCGHIFCVRCLVKLKQRGQSDCPLCRKEGAIALADSSNLDLAAMLLIKKSFPLEVKEKLKEIDREKYDEMVRPDKSCIIV